MTDSRPNFQFLIVDAAMADLHRCRQKDSYAAAVISQHLRELRGNVRRCEDLVDVHYEDSDIANVTPVWSLQDERINAYRVKLVRLGSWRLIVAVDYRGRRVALLAVMHRDENYEDNAALWERIGNDYDSIGFPRLGR